MQKTYGKSGQLLCGSVSVFNDKKNVEKMLVTVGLKQDLIQQNKAVE
jgi:hypothetical protein